MQKTYVVPVSGGKDSQATLQWALRRHRGKNIRVVHQNTGYDHPLTYRHMRYMEKFYGVKIEHTHSERFEDIFDLIEKERFFPNGLARNCTRHLKQRPFAQWLRDNDLLAPGACRVYMGMRASEGRHRNAKYGELEPDSVLYLPQISTDYKDEFQHVEVVLPLVEKTTEQVLAYVRSAGAKLNPLYAKGHERVGCYPCLLANNKEWKLAANDPVGRAHMQKLVQIEDAVNAQRGFEHRKNVQIHSKRDVRALLRDGTGFASDSDEVLACDTCSI